MVLLHVVRVGIWRFKPELPLLLAMHKSSLDLANFVVAVLAVALAIISLLWQAITWRLSGGMAKVNLFLGAIDSTGSAYITVPAKYSIGEMERLKRQGFSRKVAILTVWNTGRLPITVHGWQIEFQKRYKILQTSFVMGPDLPFRIDIGESGTWAVDLQKIAAISSALESSAGSKSVKIRTAIKLGDSRLIRAPQTMRL